MPHGHHHDSNGQCSGHGQNHHHLHQDASTDGANHILVINSNEALPDFTDDTAVFRPKIELTLFRKTADGKITEHTKNLEISQFAQIASELQKNDNGNGHAIIDVEEGKDQQSHIITIFNEAKDEEDLNPPADCLTVIGNTAQFLTGFAGNFIYVASTLDTIFNLEKPDVLPIFNFSWWGLSFGLFASITLGLCDYFIHLAQDRQNQPGQTRPSAAQVAGVKLPCSARLQVLGAYLNEVLSLAGGIVSIAEFGMEPTRIMRGAISAAAVVIAIISNLSTYRTELNVRKVSFFKEQRQKQIDRAASAVDANGSLNGDIGAHRDGYHSFA